MLAEGGLERLVEVDVRVSTVCKTGTHEGEHATCQGDHKRLQDHEVYFVNGQIGGPTFCKLDQPVDRSDKDQDNSK